MKSDSKQPIRKMLSAIKKKHHTYLCRPTEINTTWLGYLTPSDVHLALVPSYYQSFQSLQNSLNGENSYSLEACKNNLEQFITQKNAIFCKDRMKNMSQMWGKAPEQKWIIQAYTRSKICYIDYTDILIIYKPIHQMFKLSDPIF